MKTITFPNYQRVTLWEAEIRAAKGDSAVNEAYRKIGLTGNESPVKAKTFIAKWNALRELDPSITLPRQTREAVQNIGKAVMPATPSPATLANQPKPIRSFAPTAPPKQTPPGRPAIDGNLRGLDRMRASIRADIEAGTHGLPPPAASDDPWKLPASLSSVPRVGNKVDRLTLDQLGVLAIEVFGEVATCLLVATSESDAQTLHRLERQFFIENLKIPGQTAESFSPNLRMSPQVGIFAGPNRRQQCRIDAFVAHLEESNPHL